MNNFLLMATQRSVNRRPPICFFLRASRDDVEPGQVIPDTSNFILLTKLHAAGPSVRSYIVDY